MEQCVIFPKNSINKIKRAGRSVGWEGADEQLSEGSSRREFLSTKPQQKLHCEPRFPWLSLLVLPMEVGRQGGGSGERDPSSSPQSVSSLPM